jgi:uncharacterized membrane protein YgaE (UPF0421/DUF939 family)
MPRLREREPRMLGDRAGPLLEEAAVRSRVSMRMRIERLRLSWRSIVQAGVAAAAAWVIATKVFRHTQPFFAPVSAVIVLGLTIAERGRRAIEVAVGVAVGIAVGDLLVIAIGVGAAQLALVVMLAIATAILLGSGQMLANQAAVSAALVATIQPPTIHGVTFARFLDGLAGGVTALVVSGLVLPANPVREVRRAARPVLDELAATLDDIAAAILARDREMAETGLLRARGIDELSERFAAAVGVSRDTARFAPPRRRFRREVEDWAAMAGRIDLAVRNVRVLARGTIRAVRLSENMPPETAEAVCELAATVRALSEATETGDFEPVREAALRAAATATRVLESTGNMSVNVIVGQVRSTATDLLAATGMSHDEAADAVTRAASEQTAAHA